MSLNRRNFFTKGIKNFGQMCREAVDEHKREKSEKRNETLSEVFRPPGAVAEKEFLERCTRCDDCIAACPHEVLFKVFDYSSKSNLTPNLSPGIDPCLMCEDLPCITACETGALVMPAEGDKPRIGLAQIYIDDCLNWRDQDCHVCVDECPEKAILFDNNDKVRVKADLCTGCGICENTCPVGNAAIEVVIVEKL